MKAKTTKEKFKVIRGWKIETVDGYDAGKICGAYWFVYKAPLGWTIAEVASGMACANGLVHADGLKPVRSLADALARGKEVVEMTFAKIGKNKFDDALRRGREKFVELEGATK